MIKVEHINTYNFDGALRGMRNPLESWDKSDSFWDGHELFIIGEKDLKLAQNLIKAGQDHRKFIRQILVSMDITASMSFWWDIDTYKIATEKNSTSRMHKIMSRHLTYEDFEWTKETSHRNYMLSHFNALIDIYNRQMKNEQSDSAKATFEELIMDLPQGFKFTRHWTGNYEVLRKIYFARKNHKQREIREFCKIIETLPYAKELIMFEG